MQTLPESITILSKFGFQSIHYYYTCYLLWTILQQRFYMSLVWQTHIVVKVITEKSLNMHEPITTMLIRNNAFNNS